MRPGGKAGAIGLVGIWIRAGVNNAVTSVVLFRQSAFAPDDVQIIHPGLFYISYDDTMVKRKSNQLWPYTCYPIGVKISQSIFHDTWPLLF
jgi:hypothetical protein